MVPVRWLAAFVGVAMIGVALGHPDLRDPEGLLRGLSVLPGAAGIGLLLIGLAPRDLVRSAWWLAASLIGAGAAVQLAEAGPAVRYQHYLPWSELTTRPLALALVMGHFLVVGVGAVRILAPALVAMVRRFGALRSAVLVVLLLGAAATVSRDLDRYAGEMALAILIRLSQLANVALVVACLPIERRLAIGRWAERALGAVDDAEGSGRWAPGFAWRLAGFTTVLTAFLSFAVYERHPHVPDEYHYIWQARYLAHGLLALPIPPAPRAFDIFLTGFETRGWYSVVPPGWPAILSIGARFGLEWLVNPILAGLNVVLADRVLSGVVGPRTGRLAGLLLAAAPWHFFLGMSYMPQIVTVSLFLATAWCIVKARASDQARWGWIGGFALGALAIVRQLDAMIAAASLGLWAIGLGGRRLRLGATAGMVLGSLAVAAVILPYNRYFTGQASVFPIMAYSDQRLGPGANAYGFGKDRGMGWEMDPNPGHSPIDGMINTNLNLSATELDLFGWASGSLFLAIFCLLVGSWTRVDRALTGLLVLIWAAYFLNYFSGGPDFGARYWFLMLMPLIVLTARGATRLGSLLADVAGPSRPVAASHGAALAGLATLVIGAAVVYTPWRSIDKYRHFRGMRPDIRALAAHDRFANGLVLINGRAVPDYASAAVYNPLDFSTNQPIYAWNRDSTVAGELRAAFPDRTVWLLDGPTVTKSGYRVVAGPVKPGEPLR